jgi:hypothetical protein
MDTKFIQIIDEKSSIWMKNENQNVNKFILVPNLCFKFRKLEKNEKKGRFQLDPLQTTLS